MTRMRRNPADGAVVFYGLQDLDGYRGLVCHSTRQHLHRNVLAVHVVVDVGVHALRQDARVPEQVLRADEHKLGQHDGVPARSLRNVWLSYVILVGRSCCCIVAEKSKVQHCLLKLIHESKIDKQQRKFSFRPL